MEMLGAIFEALLALFGYIEDRHMTRELCEQLWAPGYVAYPVQNEDLKRLQECNDIMSYE